MKRTSHAAVVTVVAAVLSLGGAFPGEASGQAPADAAGWVHPTTPWGDPDLQGVWTSDSARGIPFQRPEELGGRAELTDEEFAAKVAGDEQARNAALNASGSFRNDSAWNTKTFRQTSLVVEPANGRIPALTPAAQERRSPAGTFGDGPFDGPEDFSMYDRCISLGVPGSITPKIYGNGSRIVQGPGYVAISYEMIHETRIVRLDGGPHLGEDIRLYTGDSRGRWEGHTLVVETTNLTDRLNAPGSRVRSSTQMRLVERFTRTEADVLLYEVAFDDPGTFTAPWKMVLPLASPAGYMLLPYECHEGNRAIMQALGGERAEDRAVEEDRTRGIIRPRRPIQGGLTVGGQPLNNNE